MKSFYKSLILLAGSALLLAGCAKEFQEPSDGGLQTVTFTATVADGDVTKATADSDGAAASVNRCIMEIYYGDELFARQYAAVSNKTASFTTQLVANRTYTVAFWADYVHDASTDDGLQTDSCYVTSSLKDVKLNGTYAGNDDKRDAFAFSGKFTVAQGGSSFTAKLRRPFAQINVITTDVATVKTVSGLEPEKVNLTIKSAVSEYNVLDSTAVSGKTSDLTYTADVYNWDASKSECTLSMDYLFAEKTKGLIDIDWRAQKSGDSDVSHSFANIPYKRNYRTNIKGALLTTQGQWNVTVDPVWNKPDTIWVVKSAEVVNIAAMNTFVSSNASANQYDITFTEQPADAGEPGTGDAKAILTTPLKSGNVMNVSVESKTKVLYIGDYTAENVITLQTSNVNAATVNINIPSGGSIGTLIINAPSKSVYLNGALVSSVGTLTNVEATTSAHTFVVEKNQTISGTLTVHQGGLEIHGSVNAVVISETDHANNPVKVRECEGLSAAVYNALKAYIDVENGYFGEQESGKETYCIRKEVVAKVGDTDCYTIAEAFAAVKDGETITLTKNCETGSQYVLTNNMLCLGQANATLDLNSYEITVTNNFSFAITADNVTVKNGKISAGATPESGSDYRKCGYHSFSLVVGAMNSGNKITGVQIEGVTFKGGISFGGSSDNLTSQCTGAGCGTLKNCQITSGMSAAIYAQQNGSAAVVLSGTYNKHSDATNPLVCTEANTSVSLKGGIYNDDPTNWVAEGYTVVENTDEQTKTDYPYAVVVLPDVAQIGETKYKSLADAIAAVPTTGDETTITLLNSFDVTGTNPYTIAAGMNVVLDLNGKTISYVSSNTGADALITNNGNLTINDGSPNKDGKITAYQNTDKSYGYGCYTIDNRGALTIEDGIIDNTSDKPMAWTVSNGSYGSTSNLTVNGGTVHSQNYQAIRQYLQEGGIKTTVINGGKIISGGYDAFQIQYAGNSFVSGSSFTINGGEIQANTSIFYVDMHFDNVKCNDMSLDIKGGVFKYDTEDGILSEDFEGHENTSYTPLSSFIRGGEFDTDPSAYVAEGYEAVQSGSTWTVQQQAN